MTFLALKLLVLNTLGWCQQNWRIVLGVVLFFAFLLGSWLAYRKYVNYRIAKVDAQLEAVDKAVADGKIGSDAIDTQTPKKEAVNASNSSEKAIQDVNKARNTDSSSSNADAESARARFCRAYPDDSACK